MGSNNYLANFFPDWLLLIINSQFIEPGGADRATHGLNTCAVYDQL